MTLALRAAAETWYVHCFQRVRTNGFYERGIYRRINSEVTSHRGNVQPATGKDIARLAEGSRADGALTVFCDVEMRTAESPNQVADRVLYNGTEYEVSNVERWHVYSRYTLTKVGQ